MWWKILVPGDSFSKALLNQKLRGRDCKRDQTDRIIDSSGNREKLSFRIDEEAFGLEREMEDVIAHGPVNAEYGVVFDIQVSFRMMKVLGYLLHE